MESSCEGEERFHCLLGLIIIALVIVITFGIITIIIDNPGKTKIR